MNQTYAYMRVSTKEQNEDCRMICMQKLGIPEACGMPVSSVRYCAKKVGKIVYYFAHLFHI